MPLWIIRWVSYFSSQKLHDPGLTNQSSPFFLARSDWSIKNMWQWLGQSQSFLNPDMQIWERDWKPGAANGHPSSPGERAPRGWIHREERGWRWCCASSSSYKEFPYIPSHSEVYFFIGNFGRSGLLVSSLETAQRSLLILPALPGCERIRFKVTLYNHQEQTYPGEKYCMICFMCRI